MPICSKMQGHNVDTTFGIMDVKGEWEWLDMKAEVRTLVR